VRYRSKVVEIEAVQMGYAEFADKSVPIRGDVPMWLHVAVADGTVQAVFGGEDYWYLEIKTLEGTMRAGPDDWIIQGLEGELYPCKDSVFKAKYEAV
jgi:hypothetical protein